jgi:hypothetical protein
MDLLVLARRYLMAMQAHQGVAVAAMFTADGVLDDGNGGHHQGPEAITAFIDSLRANVVVEEVAVRQAPCRVTVFGRVGSDELERSLFRWVFHFEGELIGHLGNSYLRELPDLVS